MGCFSVGMPSGWWAKLTGPQLRVSATNIFARMIAPGVQGLAYSMNLSVKRDVAMVLPLPIRPGGGDRGLRFIDLRHRPTMFEDLAGLFEDTGTAIERVKNAKARLAVQEVGSFFATYVPTLAQFDRVDPRFRLPEVLFSSVPAYRDYAFAVFQLSPGAMTVHPMGIRFATREPDRMYFPTVHLRDDRWNERVEFDHTLYYQHPKVTEAGGVLDGDRAGRVLPSHSYGRLLDPHQPVLRRIVRGEQPNADLWIDVGRPTALLDT